MRAQFLWAIVVAITLIVEQVRAEQVGPRAGAAPSVEVTISCPETTIVAGENLEFSVTIRNPSDKVVSTAPLQPFAVLTLHVESEGKVIPPQLKVQLKGYDPNVTLGAGQTLKKDQDLCTWFPLGFYAGTFEISVTYLPVRNDRSIVLRSNVVKVEVQARTPQQETQYQEFREMLRASGKEAIDKCKQFLKEHPKSMFEPRVRIHCAGYPDLMKEVNEIEGLLGDAFERSSPTRPERNFARDLRARALEKNGRIKEAISVLQDVDEYWADVKLLTLRQRLEFVEHGPPPTEGEREKEGSEQKGGVSTRSDAKPD